MKINITKATGNGESLELLTAFKAENMSYIIFDSERVGSMGLPIIYISKLNGKLEKIDNNSPEWQNVKNYLKGIINGTNFEYFKVENTLSADEVFYTPLTLPQASFDLIKSRYNVVESERELSVGDMLMNSTVQPPVAPVNDIPVAPASVMPEITPVAPLPQEPLAPVEPVMDLSGGFNPIPPVAPVTPVPPVENVMPATPIMPNNNVASNIEVNSAPVINSPEIAPVPPVPVEPPVTPPVEIPVSAPINTTPEVTQTFAPKSFDNDKETFLKACENMFDALVSKYEKELANREQILQQKEQEIEEKLKNAAARETVANVAYDNAGRVMDINNFMPNIPNNSSYNQAGVI